MLTALEEYGLDGSDRWCDEAVALGHQMTWLTPESQHETLPLLIPRRGWRSSRTRASTIESRCARRWAFLIRDARRSPTVKSSWPATQSGASTSHSIYWAISRLPFGTSANVACSVLATFWAYGHFTTTSTHSDSSSPATSAASGRTGRTDRTGLVIRLGSFPTRRKLSARYAYLVRRSQKARPWPLADHRCQWPQDLGLLESRKPARGSLWVGSTNTPRCCETLLDQSVRARIRSAYPVGAHLSGGLDSSSIAVLASRALREQGDALTGFSWAPPPSGDAPHDEREMVEQNQPAGKHSGALHLGDRGRRGPIAAAERRTSAGFGIRSRVGRSRQRDVPRNPGPAVWLGRRRISRIQRTRVFCRTALSWSLVAIVAGNQKACGSPRWQWSTLEMDD